MSKEIQIEKATPKQFILGIKGYIEILERENIELKELINKNDYTIKQLKLILETATKTLEVQDE